MGNRLKAAQQELLALMGELSDRYCSAHWLTNLEYNLWDALLHGPKHYGYEVIDSEVIAAFSSLSQKVGGWFWWPKEADEEQFIPLDEWQRRYALWAAKQAEQ